MGANLILYLIIVPLMMGGACLFLRDDLKSFIKGLTVLVTTVVVVSLFSLFLAKPVFWPDRESALFLVDNLSGFIGLGVAFFAFILAIYSCAYVEKNVSKFFSYFLITLGASFGVAFSNNLIVLVVFWGILALTLYMMINLAQTNSSTAAAKKALLMVGGTDSLMILGVCLVWFLSGTVLMDKIHLSIGNGLTFAAYISILCAILAKVGAVPFHGWFPDAAESAPTPVTAYLPASLDKLLGIYLLARMSLNLFVQNSVTGFILLFIGALTIVIAASLAIFQKDLKRLLGYCAVSQVGYMLIGIGTGNPIGIVGGLFHMINHAIYKSCFFLTSGVVEKKTGTTDLNNLGGLSKYLPVTFACFLVAALSVSGVPPFNGFVSKWMVYQGIIQYGKHGSSFWVVCLVAAMFGSAFTMASIMKIIHAVFLGRPAKDYGAMKEAGLLMMLPSLVLSIICLIFGIFAFSIPLSKLVIPATGLTITYLGFWNPTVATYLILAGIIVGSIGYLFNKKMKSRQVPPFIGGEDVQGFDKLSGVDFYNTVKKEPPFVYLYGKDDEMKFVHYLQKKRFAIFFTRALQDLHNGVLPTQLVWALLGMVAIFFAMFYWVK